MTTIARSLLTFLTFGVALSAQGRPPSGLTYEEMVKLSDLIVIVSHRETVKSGEKLATADQPEWVPEESRYKAGRRNPEDYQGLHTEFDVGCVLKGGAPEKLRVAHFFYNKDAVEFNGGLFAYFHSTDTRLQIEESGDTAGRVIHRSHKPSYLAFLKRREDGVYVPVGGHYDSASSFRLLTSMLDGSRIYAERHFAPKED